MSQWISQPMPHERSALPEGPIVPNLTADQLRQEPYGMPAGFEWGNVSVNAPDSPDLTELYTLLTNNYVEDGDATFRFDYSADFLRWALAPPGSNPDFIFGVRSSKSKKLMAFISGVPTKVQVNDAELDVVEINFLCVHKKLRSKRLAPVLIKEVTRRANLTGIFQAVYTSGTVLPVPVSSARYYHRNLNPKKLVDVGFTRCPPRMTMARYQKTYKLPETTSIKGLRLMEESDVPNVHKLLNKYLSRFSLKVLFTEEEIRHWLLPRDNVIQSYVIQNEEGYVTDFISFYHLKSNVLNIAEKLNAAYSFYNVALTVPLVDLMKDALILAKNSGCDVFNALELMENKSFFEPLRFGPGDGMLQYYVYNWSCSEIPAEKVGIVLL